MHMLEQPKPKLASTPATKKSILSRDDETDAADTVVYERPVLRTPSPTPSEVAFLDRNGLFDKKRMKSWSFWFRKEWIWRYIIGALLLVLAILFSAYHEKIVIELEPASQELRDMPGGWLIPVAIMVILSFPPLVGHEVVIMLTGLVWGFWIGFGISAAGTLLGEIANFYAFRYCCQARGTKYENKNLRYACLARAIREGGFRVALISRYSLIPGHLLTAVFSTCGMKFPVYVLSAVLSLPKQASFVYLGVALDESGDGEESSKERILSAIVIAATIIVTIIAMRYMNRKMGDVKVDVVYARRKARLAKQTQSSDAISATELVAAEDGGSLRMQDSHASSKPQPLYSLQRYESSSSAYIYSYPPLGIERQ